MNQKITSALILILFIGLSSGASKLVERFNWRQLDWVFPNPQIRERAIASGDYIPRNGLPVGIERWQNKLFVTVPRWRNGKFYVLSGKINKIFVKFSSDFKDEKFG